MEAKKTTRWIIASVLYIAVFVYVFRHSIINVQGLSLNEAGNFLAGLFAPLAFLWVILGYYQQGRELNQSNKALKQQAKELEESVEQQRQLVQATQEAAAWKLRRETSLLANKVVAATVMVDDLANQLRMEYDAMAVLVGQPGGGLRDGIIEELRRKQAGVLPMQQRARDYLALDVAPTDEERADYITEFEGFLASLERVKEKFIRDLASLEIDNRIFRAEAIQQH